MIHPTLLALLATMNPVVAHKLHVALELAPPRYLFAGAAAGLFLGWMLRRRGASGRVYGTFLGVGGIALMLWVVALFIMTFFHLFGHERYSQNGRTAIHCSERRPCPTGLTCVASETPGKFVCVRATPPAP